MGETSATGETGATSVTDRRSETSWASAKGLSEQTKGYRVGPMPVVKFQDLECWKSAKSLAVELYALSNSGELGKDFSFKDQIRRAAVSVASNIAEGKERETIQEFIRYLFVAKGSAGELMTQLMIAEEIGYIDRERCKNLKEHVRKLTGMIGALIKTLKNGGSCESA